ncbi:MAG TPA: hypothetical protein VHE61_09905 [Opitutaceae bacterium]|nr:hypothetical protein [Opitutaceae bacterium]
MKFIFLSGGFAGFCLTALASFWAGHEPDRILFDGAVGCLIGALLFRWFWTVLVRGIRETVVARQTAAAATAAANAAAKSK